MKAPLQRWKSRQQSCRLADPLQITVPPLANQKRDFLFSYSLSEDFPYPGNPLPSRPEAPSVPMGGAGFQRQKAKLSLRLTPDGERRRDSPSGPSAACWGGFAGADGSLHPGRRKSAPSADRALHIDLHYSMRPYCAKTLCVAFSPLESQFLWHSWFGKVRISRWYIFRPSSGSQGDPT